MTSLGEDVANELVDWFNAVDSTYRTDLRELNELNFARFDAKLEQHLAELRIDLAALDVRILGDDDTHPGRPHHRAASSLSTPLARCGGGGSKPPDDFPR